MTNTTKDRTLLFMMNAEQTETFVRLLGAAERGDGAAACQLGDMYREALGGMRYSPKEARRWYAKSALTGDANGRCNLGACYEHGLGCTQSYVKAVKWYQLSDAQGHGTASMNLGYCYLHGHGVPADRVEALRLFRLAVERGEPRAAEELERLAEPEEDGPKGRLLRGVSTVQTESVTSHRPEDRSRCTPAAVRSNTRGTLNTLGRHFGLVGIGGVAPLEDEDSALEKIRLELLEVLKAGDEAAAATDQNWSLGEMTGRLGPEI